MADYFGVKLGFRSAVIVVLLIGAASLSGCRDLLHDLQRASWKSCERDYDETDSVDTDFGEIRVVEVEGTCPDAGTWQIWGPGEVKVKDLSIEPEELAAKFKKPYWLRVSAEFDGEKRAWDHVVSKLRHGTVRAEQCEALAMSTSPPSLTACLGDRGDSDWAPTARYLGNSTIFDKAALAQIQANPDDPAQLITPLSYFAGTWSDRDKTPQRREGRRNIRRLVQDLGCFTMVKSAPDRMWWTYVTAIEVIMGEQASEFLRPCDRWLVEHWPDQPNKLRPRLDDPRVVDAIDAALLERPESLNKATIPMWLERLEQSPRPPTEVVDLMDRYLFETPAVYADVTDVTYSENPLADRLENEIPIAAPNAALLSTQLTQCCLDGPLLEPAVKRAEMAKHRDAIDDSFIDLLVHELSKNELSRDLRDNLKTRIELADTHPFGEQVRERLGQVLAHNLPALSEEAVMLLEHSPTKAARKAFLALFDAEFAKAYPEASAAFLKRLEPGFWPAPDETTRKAIIEKARAMKKRGESFDKAACKVLIEALVEAEKYTPCRVPDVF